MDLYEEILVNLLEGGDIQISFPNFKIDPNKIVEMECYQALEKIKAILVNDDLNDKECFKRMEEVVSLFEKLGSNTGSRHDFG